MNPISTSYEGHKNFIFSDAALFHVTFSSDFDNGNLHHVEAINSPKPFLSLHYPATSKIMEYKIWTAHDNHGTSYQAKNSNSWFHFQVSGVDGGTVIRIYLKSVTHGNIYKHDMRPVIKSRSTNNTWARIKSSTRYIKNNDAGAPVGSQTLYFEHMIESGDDVTSCAFTYPYTYTMLQDDLHRVDMEYQHHMVSSSSSTTTSSPTSSSSVTSSLSTSSLSSSNDDIIYHRELLTTSCDGRRIDLITITSSYNVDHHHREPHIDDQLFPDQNRMYNNRPHLHHDKMVVFISARVHPGEVPAQHTWRGIFDFLLDKTDIRAKELRRRYVFKMIPMLNPDGVYRGHFRHDQHGQNLNRLYNDPDPVLQPSIYAAKLVLDYHAQTQQLCMYLDLHAHSSKRGCFIYGNVLDDIDSQVQNQLYCKLLSLNSPHFDYDSCLFSLDHMMRSDPGDHGLTAEGSGRVSSYMNYHIIHSYTLECNYNSSKLSHEISSMHDDPHSDDHHKDIYASSSCIFTPLPEKYTPASYMNVGASCMIALLDMTGHNIASRIITSKHRSVDKVRMMIMNEVKQRKEYKSSSSSSSMVSSSSSSSSKGGKVNIWRRIIPLSSAATSSMMIEPSPIKVHDNNNIIATEIDDDDDDVDPIKHHHDHHLKSSSSSPYKEAASTISSSPNRSSSSPRSSSSSSVSYDIINRYDEMEPILSISGHHISNPHNDTISSSSKHHIPARSNSCPTRPSLIISPSSSQHPMSAKISSKPKILSSMMSSSSMTSSSSSKSKGSSFNFMLPHRISPSSSKKSGVNKSSSKNHDVPVTILTPKKVVVGDLLSHQR